MPAAEVQTKLRREMEEFIGRLSDRFPTLGKDFITVKLRSVGGARLADRSPARAERDGESIPAVDRDQSDGQIHQLLFAEVVEGLLIDLIGHSAPGEEGDDFGPDERRPLPCREFQAAFRLPTCVR